MFCYKNDYLSMVSVCIALILMYEKVGKLVGAEHMYGEMIFQGFVYWNALITGYADNGVTGVSYFFILPDV